MHTRIRRTLGLLAVFAVVASLLLPATVTAAGPGSGGETSIGNNLSYPNIWSDGAPLALRGTAGTPQFGTPCATIGGQAIYCQQDPNSTWQADNEVATAPVDVSSIDWGDNLEARPWAAGSQVRVETTLYETLPTDTTMNGYNMVVVSGARSTEMQGTNGSTYESPTATIFSRAARLTIQPITSGDTLFWNPTTTQWTGAGVGAPLYNMAVFQAGDGPGQYTGEINVSGKVVYGYNWKTPAVAGTYRVTFSLDKQGFELANLGSTLKTYITDATTILPGEADAKGGVAQVDGTNNLSYIDVTLTPPRGGGGGGGETTIGNNLSYPAIWSDGDPLALRGTELEAVLNGAYTTVGDTNWYHQQDADNTWQAENTAATGPVDVSQIDWGDNLEARQWAAGQQVRVETTLFKDLTTPMQAYNMLVLSGSGTSEMQGTDGNTFDSSQAIIFSRAARLTIQQITPGGTLTWDPNTGQWTGAVVGDPLYNMAVFEAGDGPGQYTGEINVGGKVVYGYNWKTPATPGTYRITFSLDGVNYPGTLNTHITNATSIMPSDETDATGGVAQIDGTDNLSYIDVTLTNPNGGGGGTVTHDAQVVSVNAPASVTRGGSGTISAVVQNNGSETEPITVALSESPDGYTAEQTVTLDSGASTTVNFDWATDASTTTGEHTFTVTATVPSDANPDNNSVTTSPPTQVQVPAPTAMSVAGISLTTQPAYYLYTLRGAVTIMIGSTPVNGATVAANWTYPNGTTYAASATTNSAGQATFSRTVFTFTPSVYTLTVTNVSKSGVPYDRTANVVNSQSITVPTPSGGTTHDAQVLSVSAPASVDRGNPVTTSAVVKNNGNVSDTFTVSLKESPDNYTASQSVTLAAGASTTVPFTWATNAATSTGGHTFTVTASVTGDANAGNNSGSATTQVQVPVTPIHDAQVVSVTPPPTVDQGSSATINATVMNNGNVTDTFSVALSESPGGFSATKSVTLAAGDSAVVTFNWPTSTSTATGLHTFTVTASVGSDANAGNNSGTANIQVQAGTTTTMSVSSILLSKSGSFLVYQLTGVVTVKSASTAVSGATVTASWAYPNGSTYAVTGTTNSAGQVTFTRTVFTFQRATYSLTVTNVVKAGLTYNAGGNAVTTQTITVP